MAGYKCNKNKKSCIQIISIGLLACASGQSVEDKVCGAYSDCSTLNALCSLTTETEGTCKCQEAMRFFLVANDQGAITTENDGLDYTSICSFLSGT